MTFSERLDALIKERKTTQKALAEYAGVRYSSISDWKKDGSFPRADIAVKMAEYLNTSVEYLITGKEPENSKKAVLDDLQIFIDSHR